MCLKTRTIVKLINRIKKEEVGSAINNEILIAMDWIKNPYGIAENEPMTVIWKMPNQAMLVETPQITTSVFSHEKVFDTWITKVEGVFHVSYNQLKTFPESKNFRWSWNATIFNPKNNFYSSVENYSTECSARLAAHLTSYVNEQLSIKKLFE